MAIAGEALGIDQRRIANPLEQGRPARPATILLKTFSLSVLFMLALGLLVAAYASIPT
jgi:hypothetical protein